MRWWQVGLIGTALWFVAVVAVSGFLIWKIATDPTAPQAVKDRRLETSGGALGTISAVPLAGVWFYAWRRRASQG